MRAAVRRTHANNRYLLEVSAFRGIEHGNLTCLEHADNQTIADLDLAVFSKSSATVLDMIKSMDREGVFHADLVNQNLQKGRGESGTEYELRVVYQPRAGFASESLAAVQEQTKSTGEAK